MVMLMLLWKTLVVAVVVVDLVVAVQVGAMQTRFQVVPMCEVTVLVIDLNYWWYLA
jgi:hypothetical protein